MGVPVATYRQAAAAVEDDLRRIPGNGHIELPTGSDANAHASRAGQVAMLARGFVDLDKRLASLESKRAKPGTKKNDSIANVASPGVLLAQVLEHPEVAAHLDTFACGDQGAIAEILRASKHETHSPLSTQNRKRLIAAVGIWLADLVMAYPGVLLTATAAASYLDISEAGFAKRSVRNLFSSAQYEGLPFADSSRPLWWRHLLDAVVDEADCSTGLEVAVANKIKGLSYCPCYINPMLHAGFLCMATDRPISVENSSGQVRWFPPGADLARLTKTTYRQLAPWIGT